MIKELLTSGHILKGIRPFLSNTCSLFFNRPNRLAPLYIVWSNTARCNQRCLTCAILDERGGKVELTPQVTLDIAEQIGRSHTWAVTLTGGEPLLRQDIFDIIWVLKKYKKLVNISTNGILLDRYIDKIISLKVDSVCISMDSHIPEVNDFIRRSPGALDRVIKGIEKLKSAKGRRRYPKISIRCVINRLNYKTLDEFIAYFKDKGVGNVVFQPIQDTGPHRVRDKQVLFQAGDYHDFKDSLTTLQKKHRFMRNYFYRHMPDFIFHPQRLLEKTGFRCLDNSTYLLFIDSSGEVSLCPGRKDTKIGNLKEKKLIDIWKSQKNYKTQKMLRYPSDCICWIVQKALNHYLSLLYKVVRK